MASEGSLWALPGPLSGSPPAPRRWESEKAGRRHRSRSEPAPGARPPLSPQHQRSSQAPGARCSHLMQSASLPRVREYVPGGGADPPPPAPYPAAAQGTAALPSSTPVRMRQRRRARAPSTGGARETRRALRQVTCRTERGSFLGGHASLGALHTCLPLPPSRPRPPARQEQTRLCDSRPLLLCVGRRQDELSEGRGDGERSAVREYERPLQGAALRAAECGRVQVHAEPRRPCGRWDRPSAGGAASGVEEGRGSLTRVAHRVAASGPR